jgi:epsin
MYLFFCTFILVYAALLIPSSFHIPAAKKVNLADVGIVGGLSDGSDEREKGPPTSFYMGRAMGSGTGLGRSGYQGAGGDDIFSSLSGGQQYPYGGFQK